MEMPKKVKPSVVRRTIRVDPSHTRPAAPGALDRFRIVLGRKPNNP
jgi:hypothetical protein